jgi:TRAP-type C4-dicarboxylate transport system permease large subunit
MVLLTVPIFFPVVTALGYDPIWFGIIVVMVAELGLITPPVGLNLFIITTVVKDLPLGTVYRGIVPFIVLDIARISLMILLPGVITFLPALMAQ